MRLYIILVCYISLYCSPIWAQAPSQETYSLSIDISELKEHKGKLYIALYDKADGFRQIDEIYQYRILDVDKNKASVAFYNLVRGDYAVTVYHDVNENGTLDKNIMGIPKEPYGFSNNPRIFMGPPSFEDAHIELATNQSIHIRLK